MTCIIRDLADMCDMFVLRVAHDDSRCSSWRRNRATAGCEYIFQETMICVPCTIPTSPGTRSCARHEDAPLRSTGNHPGDARQSGHCGHMSIPAVARCTCRCSGLHDNALLRGMMRPCSRRQCLELGGELDISESSHIDQIDHFILRRKRCSCLDRLQGRSQT
jgi:hypothetical protein